MANLLASIVINNFNYAPFLRNAIESALSQIYPQTEVIVADDGSTDDSREIIRQYGRRVIPVFKENGGQGSACNAGFKVSHGEVVIFLDADDVLFPEAVAQVVEVWGARVAKVQFRLQTLDRKGQPGDHYWPSLKRPMPSGDLRGLVLSQFSYLRSPGSGNAYSRGFLAAVAPIPENEWRICADGYLTTLAVFYGDIISIERCLGYYRFHDNNNWLGSSVADNLARAVAMDLNLEKTIRAKAAELNLKTAPNLALQWPPHATARVALRILDPDRCPTTTRSCRWLAWQAAGAFWKYRGFGFKARLFHTVWLVLMLLSPIPLAELWTEWLWRPQNRPRLVRWILGTPA